MKLIPIDCDLAVLAQVEAGPSIEESLDSSRSRSLRGPLPVHPLKPLRDPSRYAHTRLGRFDPDPAESLLVHADGHVLHDANFVFHEFRVKLAPKPAPPDRARRGLRGGTAGWPWRS